MTIQPASTVRVFDYDLSAAREVYDRQGWFHAEAGVNEELMATISAQVAELIGSDDAELASWRYPEKKEQFLWEPPDGVLIADLCRLVAESTGLDPERTVLSERHLKVYSATAPEAPPPHKDRSASTVTVGIGIDSPPDSRLVLWPESDTTFNPFPTAAEWRASRHPDELPEVVTADDPTVEINLKRGDVVMFQGANFYHERHRPARTSVLYLKFNDRGLDPLGEDPRTLIAEERSAGLVAGGIETNHVVSVSPRVVGVRSDRFFPDLGVVETAITVSDSYGTRLSSEEAAALREVAERGPTPVHAIPGGIDTVARLAGWDLVLLDLAPDHDRCGSASHGNG